MSKLYKVTIFGESFLIGWFPFSSRWYNKLKIINDSTSFYKSSGPRVALSTISDNHADVVFLYQNYGDFSGDIEYLYTEIVNRLKFKGLIN